MSIYSTSQEQIEKLTPQEFKNSIANEDDFEEEKGIISNFNGKDVVLVPGTYVDGGLGLPSISLTYNLRQLKSLPDMSAYTLDVFEKIDSTKKAYLYFSGDDFHTLVEIS